MHKMYVIVCGSFPQRRRRKQRKRYGTVKQQTTSDYHEE